MEQRKTDRCVFRTVLDGKVQLIIAVHADGLVNAGSDEAWRNSHAR